MSRCRFRDLGFRIGELPTGPINAITDIEGVKVGHTTLISGQGALQPGLGPVRTGVTVILPHVGNIYQQKVPAAVYRINGFGKAVGFEQIRELGWIESPLALTNTLNVGLVLDALVQYAIRNNPEIGINPKSGSINIVIGETNDGFLNDIQGRHVGAEQVWSALTMASPGPVQEGVVGAGTGTVCFGWKGGIGSSSRVLPPDMGSFRLGTLVQTNFGTSRDLVVLGVPVGRWLDPAAQQPEPMPGSVMVVLATDAPLESRQLERLCVRAAAGLARTGAQFGHGSGDFVIAFSTGYHIPHFPEHLIGSRPVLVDEASVLNLLFRAVIESVEESVLNSLTCAETMIGRDDHMASALPLEQLTALLRDSRAEFG